jgi:hypothetical protein
MSLTEFKITQVKTGHSCLFLGKGGRELASSLVEKKSELGLNQGLLITEVPNKYDFPHQMIHLLGVGKKNIRNFHAEQLINNVKKMLVIDNLYIFPSRVSELFTLISDKNAMSKTLIIFIFENPEEVPEGLKDVCSHVFRLSEGFPTVVETDGKVYYM